MRRFDLESSLLDVWHYALFLTDNKPLPPHYANFRGEHQSTPLNELVYPWELEVITRELILNASWGGESSLAKWSDLRTAINHVRRLDEASFELSDDKMRDVLIEVHRLAHRQFPWQIKTNLNTITRALRVYGSPGVDKLVQREFGLTTYQFVRLGMAVAGGFINRPYLSSGQDYTSLGVSLETSKALLSRLSRDITSLREETRSHQSYDRDWLYAWNPLELKPLVSIDFSRPEVLVCPLPSLILKRMTLVFTLTL